MFGGIFSRRRRHSLPSAKLRQDLLKLSVLVVIRIGIVCAILSSASAQTKEANGEPLHSWDVSMQDPAATSAAKFLSGHCGDAENQAVMNACWKLDYDSANRDLTASFHRLLTALPSEERAPWVNAESAWIRFRRLECVASSSDGVGGSLWPTEYYSCLDDMTKSRKKDLDQR